MCKILCSTGALIGRPNNRDYRLLKTLSKQLLCDGYEFMMYSTWYDEVDEIIGLLKELKLYIPVMHSDKDIGEAVSKGEFDEAYQKFDMNCRMAAEIGAESIVLHLWGGIASDSNFQNNVDAYSQSKEIADRYHVKLLVENIVCNQEDPMKHWCELQEKFQDIAFVFDTKMAAFHSQMDLLYEKEYQWLWQDNHICHYHVNDYAGGHKEWKKLNTLPIGQGHVDFDRFFAFINKIGYGGTFTVEATGFDSNGVVDIEMLNGQFKFIRQSLNL